MRRISLNEAWQSHPKVDRFAELGAAAAEWSPVRLPHDAMIGSARYADPGPANAFFPGGAWEYQRLLEWARR